MTRKLHLICNAHIDPVWLWEWEEGAAAALSTFRTAAELCEEFDGFVFNHNEALLYEWIEAFEPALFARIGRLVRAGRWHIMGGWYLQPDCNLPSGESFVRQALLGRRFFRDRFDVKPRVAVNLDPFGHTRGLVQVLAKSGYEAYLYCRPGLEDSGLPSDEVLWEGFDGSRVLAIQGLAHYNSSLGEARARVERWLDGQAHRPSSALLWGVGNHGGGASRKDLRDLARLIRNNARRSKPNAQLIKPAHPDNNVEILHSTPDAYLKDLKKRKDVLPVHKQGINPWAVGCYTSMARVKQQHRALESALFMTEKMAMAAANQTGLPYPHEDFLSACKDLAFCEFHDILPGSGIPRVEESALRRLSHGLEIVSRIRARAFFALSTGQRKTRTEEIPILVYNPHPHPIETTIDCEMEREEPNLEGTFLHPEVVQGDKVLPTQVEQEAGNISQDFRKRVVFRATLEPSSMNRFDCRMIELPERPRIQLGVGTRAGSNAQVSLKRGQIVFQTKDIEVWINPKTGLIDRYRVSGPRNQMTDCLEKNAFAALVMKDDEDSWGTRVKKFRARDTRFRLMSKVRGAQFCGSRRPSLPAVRVIEDGPVRTVVEALFKCRDSTLCQQYVLPKKGAEIEVRVRVFWNEKQRMLKLSIPTCFEGAEYWGQVAYGREPLDSTGSEVVAQQWTAVISRKENMALTCINKSSYGSDMKDGEVRLSLLRSPAYASLPIDNLPLIPQRRFIPHQDQGERHFRFWLNAGRKKARLDAIETEARLKHETPFALPYFPSGEGKRMKPFITISDPAIQLAAMKKAEKGNALIVRLFEPTGRARSFLLAFPSARFRKKLDITPFEIRTLRIDLKKGTIKDVDLMESSVLRPKP